MMKNFKQTSNKPYDRHHYKLVYSTEKSDIFDDYEDCRLVWFQTSPLLLSHIEVLDVNKGFKTDK